MMRYVNLQIEEVRRSQGRLIIFIKLQEMSEYFRKYIKKDYFPLHPSQIKFKTFFTNCIQTALNNRGYKQTDADDWNIYWCQKQFLVDTLDKMRLFPNKRVNHFRNWYQICRKDLLAKNIKRYKKQLQKEGNTQQAISYDFTPLTYNLPSEYPIFLEEYKRANKAMWIMKPIGKSQGKGIFLFNKISDIAEWSQTTNQPEAYIVQRYIHNPLLVGNKKFDMRLYALVTSHNPLTVYIYRSGFGRFTHMRYEMQDISSLEGHLTNVAVQKNSQNYDEERGGKYFIDKLRLYLNSKYGMQKVDRCFYCVQQLMIKTLVATCKLMINDKKCFELYGYDVMIDAALKPWLIQINGSPSMSANTPQDAKLKVGLLDDVFTIVNLQKILLGDEEQIGGFDLVYKDGKRFKPNILDYNGNNLNPHIGMKKEYSMIGCNNNRDQNLRKMAKMRALKIPEEQAKNPNPSNSTNASMIRNTRNQSIANNNNTNPTNARGRSMMMANNTQQAKPSSQTNTNNVNIIRPPLYQGGSGISTKKTGEEGLKLPKVITTSTNSNFNGTNGSLPNIGANKGPDTPYKKPINEAYRTGSRQSKR